MNRFSNLTESQRKSTISALTAAAKSGRTGLALTNMAEQHIWSKFGVREPLTGIIGLAYQAEKAAGLI